jgi:hypothetical protein
MIEDVQRKIAKLKIGVQELVIHDMWRQIAKLTRKLERWGALESWKEWSQIHG